MSMDSNGKIIFAKHSEIQQANLKNIAGECKYMSQSHVHVRSTCTVRHLLISHRGPYQC